MYRNKRGCALSLTMDNTSIYKIFTWLCIFCSLIMNTQLTIAIIISMAVMVITLNLSSDKLENNIDKEELIDIMKLSKDEIKEKIAFSLMVVSMAIMLIVSTFNIIILF